MPTKKLSPEYHAYLASPEWQEKRQAALEAAGRRCQVCNTPKRLDVHHRTYERFKEELPGDLTVLCRSCHELFHENKSKAVSGAKKKRESKKKKGRTYPEAVFEGMTVRIAAMEPGVLHTNAEMNKLGVPSGWRVQLKKRGYLRKHNKKWRLGPEALKASSEAAATNKRGEIQRPTRKDLKALAAQLGARIKEEKTGARAPAADSR